MCSQKTGRACGTSGSRELCGSGVPDERTARLQAAGDSTIHKALSGAQAGARCGSTNALEGASGPTHALWLSPADRNAVTRRDGGKSQARISAVSRGTTSHADTAAAADSLEWASQGAGSESAERKMVDGFRQ